MTALLTTYVEEYANNRLIDACGSIPDERILLKKLACSPQPPQNIATTPRHIRLHQLGSLATLHVPTEEGIKLATSIDFVLRQSYVHRRPDAPETWRRIYTRDFLTPDSFSRPLVVSVFGLSGTGKSRAIERSLSLYDQVVVHDSFPYMVGPFKQLVWLKVDVPGSGRSADLADQLMMCTDVALGTNYFEKDLQSSRRPGPAMLRAWLQKASAHFLGVLVLDEVQNFFKLPTKKSRQKLGEARRREPLRIIDDETIKFILTLANTSRIAIVASGTPDGMAAFASRFSTAQRMTTGGFHKLLPIVGPEDRYYKRYLLPILFKYQWFDEKLPLSPELQELLYEKSAGVPRILMFLWTYAQRCALEREGRSISKGDFDQALRTYLAPVVPAVSALMSNDPNRIFIYEDIISTLEM
jgi:hypothetical protein